MNDVTRRGAAVNGEKGGAPAIAERLRRTGTRLRAPEAEPTPWGWLVTLTMLAVGLRPVGLNSGLWYDEIVTLHESVRAPLWQIVTAFPTNNQHTLFSVLAHLSVGVFGEHPWSLRLPAMVLGAATVPSLYLFARELNERTEALLAGFLLTVAYHHVWFSQNARGYTALAFLTVLSSWLLLRGLRRGRTSDFIWYGIAAALNMYTHLTMVFVVFSHGLLCALLLGRSSPDPARPARWQPAIGFAIAAALTLALYAPLLAGMQQFFVEREQHPEVATPAWAALALLRGLRVGVAGWSAGLVGSGLVLTGLWSYFKQSPLVTGLFVVPGVVTVAGTIVLHRPILPRFLFFLAGFAVLIAVRGALEAGRMVGRPSTMLGTALSLAKGRGRASVPSRTPAASLMLVAAMAAASLAALMTNYRYPKQDFDGALRFVEERRAVNEPIVTVGATAYAYRRHYGRDFPAVESLAELQRIRAGGSRVWVLHTLDESIEAEMPDLMRVLRADCAVARSFPGTLGQGNGDVTVCTAPPVATATQ